jgi:hypothetical protein
MEENSMTAATLFALLLGCASGSVASPPPIGIIEVTPARVRARLGDQLVFVVRTAEPAPRAVVLTPGGGTRPLTLEPVRPGEHRVQLTLAADGAPGLYLIHVWIGDVQRPSAIGKAAVVAGSMVMDFFLPAYLDRADPQGDLSAYLDDFRELGGNTLIAHALITPDRAYFPSAIASTSIARGSPDDVVERLHERLILRAHVPVGDWDMTHRQYHIEWTRCGRLNSSAVPATLAGGTTRRSGTCAFCVVSSQGMKKQTAIERVHASVVDPPRGEFSTIETLDDTTEW